jgi:Ran GTPase-activating protein (RanGAP) involved in mRNA processing and transport
MCAFVWQCGSPPSFQETIALMLEGKSVESLKIVQNDDEWVDWTQAISNCRGIRHLSFFTSDLDYVIDDILKNQLIPKSIRYFAIWGVNLSENWRMISKISQLLKSAINLEELILDECQLGDEELRTILVDGLEQVIPSKLQTLKLNANADITDRGASYLADYFDNSTSLLSLILDECIGIGQEGVCTILKSLENHSMFSHLGAGYLKLDDNPGFIGSFLKNRPTFGHLNVIRSSISEIDIASIIECPHVYSLSTGVVPKLPRGLEGCSLERLEFHPSTLDYDSSYSLIFCGLKELRIYGSHQSNESEFNEKLDSVRLLCAIALKDNNSLRSLFLPQSTKEVTRELANSLTFNTTLEELNLEDSEIEPESFSILIESLKSNSLLRLDLREGFIAKYDFGKLAKVLEGNPQLTHLDVSRCSSDSVLGILAGSMKVNSSLRSLYCTTDDEPSEESIKHFETCLETNTSLVSVRYSRRAVPKEIEAGLQANRLKLQHDVRMIFLAAFSKRRLLDKQLARLILKMACQ